MFIAETDQVAAEDDLLWQLGEWAAVIQLCESPTCNVTFFSAGVGVGYCWYCLNDLVLRFPYKIKICPRGWIPNSYNQDLTNQ